MVVDLQRILNVIATLIRWHISLVSAVVSSVEAYQGVERLKPMTEKEFEKQLDKIKKDDKTPIKPIKSTNKIKNIKKEEQKVKKHIIITAIVSIVLTLGVVAGGFALYNYIYNLGVQSEIGNQKYIKTQVIESVKELKEQE